MQPGNSCRVSVMRPLILLVSSVGPLLALLPAMATPAAPAASSLSATPVPSGPGSTSAPNRFAAAPTVAFASLLDQLGQPITAPTTPATTAGPGTAVPATPVASTVEPPAPTASLPVPVPVPVPIPAAPVLTAAGPATPTIQPSNATIGTGSKAGPTKSLNRTALLTPSRFRPPPTRTRHRPFLSQTHRRRP